MSLRGWLWISAVLLALVVAAVAWTLSQNGSETGIRGRVLVGCLDERGDPPKPAAGIQQVRRYGKQPPLVTRFRSGPDGTFSVSLPPGHYLVVPDRASPAKGLMKPLDVTVRSGHSTEVDPFYDCGMR